MQNPRTESRCLFGSLFWHLYSTILEEEEMLAGCSTKGQKRPKCHYTRYLHYNLEPDAKNKKKNFELHPNLDLVNEAVRPLLSIY